MKKLTSLLAVVALGAGIALVGCGSDDDTNPGSAGGGGKADVLVLRVYCDNSRRANGFTS